jgi:hypothetical protein
MYQKKLPLNKSQERMGSNLSGGNSINSSFVGAPGFGGTSNVKNRKSDDTFGK